MFRARKINLVADDVVGLPGYLVNLCTELIELALQHILGDRNAMNLHARKYSCNRKLDFFVHRK